ncbi:MAG: TolC family protein [Bacteroidia bacterium]|nr:TolC family protein [Bacteroidia bacterium]
MVQVFKKNSAILALCFWSMSFVNAQDQKIWSLKDCVNRALEKNITVQQQELTTLASKADYFQSKMNLLPNLNGNVSNNWQTGFAINPATNLAREGVSFRTNSFGLNSSVPLFNGFQNMNNVKVQQYRLKASEKDLEQTKNTIILNVCNAYLRVLQSIELANSADARVASTKAQVERQKKMYDLGSSNKSRYLQLKAQMSSEELVAVNAQNTVMQAYLELWLLIELKPDGGYQVEIPPVEDLKIADEPLSIDAIFEEFSKNSPDVVASENRSKSSELSYNVARGARSPRLTLSGGVNSFYTTQSQSGVGDLNYTTSLIGAGDYNGTPIPVYTTVPTGYSDYQTTPFNTQFNRNLGTNIGLNLSIPVFNGWSVNTNIQKSKINVQSNKLNEKQTKNNLYRSISQSYVDFKSSFKKFDANKENLEANKEAFDVAEKQFDLGGMNMADYLNTKNGYIRAEADFTQAKYELVFRRKVLDFYLGKPLY